VLDEEWENTFRRWYPDFCPQRQAKKAARPPGNLPLSKKNCAVQMIEW
jgi:hypothetical protein